MQWDPVRETDGTLAASGFREGAELVFGADTAQFDFILEQGLRFSVTPEIAP